MPWELQIHTIDVAQGESALVIVKNQAQGQFYSMLIDGGLGQYGNVVDNYISPILEDRQLDYIVTSHYDNDHSGGITRLLRNDNMSQLVLSVTTRVFDQLDGNLGAEADDRFLATSTVGSFLGYTSGGYNDGTIDGTAHYDSCLLIAQVSRLGKGPDVPLATIINGAVKETMAQVRSSYGPPSARDLIKYYGSGKPSTIARRLAAFVVANKTALNLQVLMFNFLFDQFSPNNQGYFSTWIEDTGNTRYDQCQIFDPGDVDDLGLPFGIGDYTLYRNAVNGQCQVAGFTTGIVGENNRNRQIPVLGNNLIPTNPPGGGDPLQLAQAPHIYCLAVNRNVIHSNVQVSRDNGNGISIGLGIQFGQFGFFTGGDLPADGLNMIPNAFLNRPQFGNLRLIAAFKAGHHGSRHAISQNFLTAARPVSSVISCGYTQFGGNHNSVHPDQDTINLLQGQGTIVNYFLTNCKILRNFVPASDNARQLIPGNKSRVAGDNGRDPGEGNAPDGNPNPKVHRGNVVLYLNQAESVSPHNGVAGVPLPPGETYRKFNIRFYEDDDNPGIAPNISIGDSTPTFFFWQ